MQEKDSVTECVLNGSVVKVQQSFNEKGYNVAATNVSRPVATIKTTLLSLQYAAYTLLFSDCLLVSCYHMQPLEGVVPVNTSYVDGRLECRLMRSIFSASGDPQFYSLNGTSYYLMLGFGPLVIRKFGIQCHFR